MGVANKKSPGGDPESTNDYFSKALSHIKLHNIIQKLTLVSVEVTRNVDSLTSYNNNFLTCIDKQSYKAYFKDTE